MLTPTQIEYTTENSNFERILNLLSESGFTFFCIFGGSLRDSDTKQKYCTTVKDYDIRIWSEKTEEEVCSQLLQFGTPTKTQCIGTTNHRYIYFYDGLELDISIRNISYSKCHIHDCAKERVMNADVALSAIAMSETGACWVHPQYLNDRKDSTLTLIKDKCNRTNEYLKRLKLKFPYSRLYE